MGFVCRVGDHVMEKELIYEKLPADIAERHVLVMDPILATGNSAIRAIQACPFLSCLSCNRI
jgi:uracil phosphoribosyltransferase